MDLARVVPVAEMIGEDQEETEELRKLYVRAEAYLRSFKWCPGVGEAYLGLGIGGVLGLFLFRLVRSIKGQDDWLWVVVGDLPSAYFVIDRAPDPDSALRVYCELMQEWVDAVRNKRRLGDVFPVDAPADDEHAAMLDSRLKFIRENIQP